MERLGDNAKPFCIDVQSLAPPSVQLLPAKRYTGNLMLILWKFTDLLPLNPNHVVYFLYDFSQQKINEKFLNLDLIRLRCMKCKTAISSKLLFEYPRYVG